LIGIRLHGKGSIQLWSVPCLTEDVTYSVSLDEQPKLSSILLYDDYGSVIDMKWVPKSYAPSINRLGLLSVTFSDGHFRIFSIPLVSQEISKDYAVVRLTPIFDETYGDGAFISIAWTEWQDIFFAAVGTESGGIAIWQLISNRTSSKLVLVSFTPGHSACVRSLAFFARSESTSSESLFVLSAAFDGTVIAHHVFDPIQQYVIQATRGNFSRIGN
jgi:WD40 repeat protein